MKSKALPLALGGALIACLAIVVVALFSSSPTDGLEAKGAEGDLQSGDAASLVASKTELPVAANAEGDSSAGGARVALVDGIAPPALPQVEFELHSSSDLPLAGARAVLFRGEELLGKRRTDASGVASFDAGEGRASLIVATREIPARTLEVSLGAGRQIVTLERGLAVSGHVRMLDQSSIEGVRLVLTSDRPQVDESKWPEAVRATLDLDDRDKLRLVTSTDDKGHFEFSGLGWPWSGRISVGENHELLAVSGASWSEGSESVRLDDPTDKLVLDLAPYAMARGHIVTASGGPGVANASVSGNLTFAATGDDEEEPSADFTGRAGADGRFSLPIRRRNGFDGDGHADRGRWPELLGASLTIDGGSDVPRRRLELGPGAVAEGFDFGELVLERGLTLSFLVLDAENRPLPGAIGRLDGERSDPTDASGSSTVSYAPGVRKPLSVSLDGYRDGRAELPAEPAEVLTVVLSRTNRLTLTVVGPDAAPVIDVKVELTAQTPAGQPQSRRGNNRTREQRTNEKGRATFSDMPPAVPLIIVVRDAMGVSVSTQKAALEAEEWRELNIEIPKPLMAFSGIVRDEVGLALAEVNVEFADVGNANRANVSTRSDADGRFSFSGLGNSVGTLRLRKSGFAPVTLSEFHIPQPGIVADIRMERGLRLSLRVVDERGTPIRADRLWLEAAGERPFQGQRRDDNAWDFGNLPRAELLAVVTVNRREYRRAIDTLNGDQDVHIPEQGALEVTLRLEPSLLESNMQLLLRARDNQRLTLSNKVESTPYQTCKFELLLPGEYTLTLSKYVQTGQGGQWTNVGQPQRITIAPGGAQQLEFAR